MNYFARNDNSGTSLRTLNLKQPCSKCCLLQIILIMLDNGSLKKSSFLVARPLRKNNFFKAEIKIPLKNVATRLEVGGGGYGLSGRATKKKIFFAASPRQAYKRYFETGNVPIIHSVFPSLMLRFVFRHPV